jgi:heptosyltransferase-2
VSQRGWPFVRALRAERFDTALLLTNSLRTGYLAWLSGAKRRIGFARDLRGFLLTDQVVPKSRSVPHPVIDEYRRLAERLGCSRALRRMELAVTPEDQRRLQEFWSSNLALSNPKFICFNTGGAFGKAKNWPRESFVDLARRTADELGMNILIVCGPSERDDARWIAAQANHPQVFSLADAPLSIGLTKAAIRDAQLLVTTDSGPRHFAAAFETPVITLFGPTHIGWSETYYDRAEHLQLKLDCGPCQQRECPLQHHRCMKDLSVDTVFAAIQRQLTRYTTSRQVA